FVITCVRDEPTLQELATARSLIAKIPAATLATTVIHERIVLRSAHYRGLSVSESKPSDPRAVAEMMNLYSEVFGIEKTKRPFATGRFNLASSAT
ncbi:MAG: hypothetical protein ACXWIN_05190, partial [Burkholderiaceae bacterium]